MPGGGGHLEFLIYFPVSMGTLLPNNWAYQLTFPMMSFCMPYDGGHFGFSLEWENDWLIGVKCQH